MIKKVNELSRVELGTIPVRTWSRLGVEGAAASDVENRRLYVLPRRLLRDESVPRGLDEDVVQLELPPPGGRLLQLPGVRDEQRVHAHRVEHRADGVHEDELVVLVALRVLLPQVREEVAGVHAVEAVEEGVQAHLDVHLLDLGQALDVLIAPRRDAAAKFPVFDSSPHNEHSTE